MLVFTTANVVIFFEIKKGNRRNSYKQRKVNVILRLEGFIQQKKSLKCAWREYRYESFLV